MNAVKEDVQRFGVAEEDAGDRVRWMLWRALKSAAKRRRTNTIVPRMSFQLHPTGAVTESVHIDSLLTCQVKAQGFSWRRSAGSSFMAPKAACECLTCLC